MSSKKFDKQSESSKYSCLCHRSLKNQQKLIESGEIFSWRDKDGFNALMHAATLRCSDRSKSNIFTFDYLFNQKVQPYSANEKADALELIGSSCILFKYKLDTGLYYWRESFRYRCAPRCDAEVLRDVLKRAFRQ